MLATVKNFAPEHLILTASLSTRCCPWDSFGRVCKGATARPNTRYLSLHRRPAYWQQKTSSPESGEPVVALSTLKMIRKGQERVPFSGGHATWRARSGNTRRLNTLCRLLQSKTPIHSVCRLAVVHSLSQYTSSERPRFLRCLFLRRSASEPVTGSQQCVLTYTTIRPTKRSLAPTLVKTLLNRTLLKKKSYRKLEECFPKHYCFDDSHCKYFYLPHAGVAVFCGG